MIKTKSRPVDLVLWDGSAVAFEEVRDVLGDAVARGSDLLTIIVARHEAEAPSDRLGPETVLRARPGEYVVFDPAEPHVVVMTREQAERQHGLA